MFGFVIGGSGKLYLAVPVKVTDASPAWVAWAPVGSLTAYSMFGRFTSGRILLNNPTLPHAGTGRPSDPPRPSGELDDWRLLWELREHVKRTVLDEPAPVR